MKIAGQKNDGAWFRANKALKKYRDSSETGVLSSLQNLLNSLTAGPDAMAAIQLLADESGVVIPSQPTTWEEWVTNMIALGVPRQIWMGRLSFTTYSRTGSSGSYEYTARHQTEIHALGKQIRYAFSKWQHAMRAANDVWNTGSLASGNPSGFPDAVKEGGPGA